MKVLEIEIGVTYQPRPYESVRACVRVAIQEGDSIDDVAQLAAEQAAYIASAGDPDNYEDCMKLLGRTSNAQALSKMREESIKLQEQIVDYKNKLRAERGDLETLKNATEKKEQLHRIFEAANCWADFEKILLKLANAEARDEPNSKGKSVPALEF